MKKNKELFHLIIVALFFFLLLFSGFSLHEIDESDVQNAENHHKLVDENVAYP